LAIFGERPEPVKPHGDILTGTDGRIQTPLRIYFFR